MQLYIVVVSSLVTILMKILIPLVLSQHLHPTSQSANHLHHNFLSSGVDGSYWMHLILIVSWKLNIWFKLQGKTSSQLLSVTGSLTVEKRRVLDSTQPTPICAKGIDLYRIFATHLPSFFFFRTLYIVKAFSLIGMKACPDHLKMLTC